MKALLDYFVRIGDCLSQLLNVVVFLGKNANESVSGRAHKYRRISTFWAFVNWFINLVFFWQYDHCRLAYQADLVRASKMLEDR